MSQPAFQRSGLVALITGLASPWTWRMAWRDTRSSRRRLFVFSLSIVLGVAALVAIDSLNRNLRDAIEDQAKSLLGADLSIVSRSPFTPEQEAFFNSLGGEQSRETSFSSMMYLPRTGAARLVQVRALAGGFPFYGNLETTPAPAAKQFRAIGSALVEGSLATQFGLTTGEEIKLGDLKTAVAGSLVKVPGETFAFATIAPRVYIPMNLITNSGMLKKGSLVRYRVYFRFPAGTDVTAMMNTAKAQLEKFRLSHETVEKRKADLGESLTNLYRFLNLSGFIALLLGGVGIASAIQVHVREKLKSVAILRCLGCSVGQTFAIYLVQAIGLGFVGVVLGAVFGLLLQLALPHVAAGFIPFPVAFTVHWWGVARAMALGLAICSLFALLPLLAVRRVTPLAVLRGAAGAETGRDPGRVLVGLAIAAGVTAFAVSQSDKWFHGIGFAGALAGAFGVLWLVAKVITWAARRALRPAWPYVFRQGLANLYRPQNRTVLLMVALGLGTFLVLTLFLTHEAILKEMSPDRAGSRPNAILFDIQADQEAGVAALVRSQGLPVIDSSPVVTMRLQAIKGRPVDDLLKDKSKHIPDWLLRREYRSTYRDRLLDSETLVGGVWHGRVETNATVIPVSLEDGIARDMQVGLGDEIIFDVQGIPLTTKVTSLRKVDWRRVQAGFFVVFPRGVLESAPNFIILTTRVGSNADTARLQQAVAQAFPNVSSIDLNLVLQTLDGIISKISFALRCMALFTVITGVLVLAGAVLTGRYQRVQESILLRTLGASRAQVLQILFAEYLLLGVFASLTGVLLANGASWGLAKFMFKVPFVPSVWPILIATLVVATLTVATGLLTSLGITRQPPLEILRAEG